MEEAVATIEPRTLEWMRSTWIRGDECPIRTYVVDDEIVAVLERISEDACRPGELRAQATRFKDDAALTRELADAMSLQFERLGDWSWAGEVGVEARRMRHRWRLQLLEDLPSACLLKLLGARTGSHFVGTLDGGLKLARERRLNRLVALNAPKIIIDNETRMLAELSHQEVIRDVFVWEDALGLEVDEEIRSRGGLDSYGSVLEHRQRMRDELVSAGLSGGYGGEGGCRAIDSVLGWVHAEVALARAVRPTHPVWVVKLDVEDFFPSLHHAPLLDMLTAFGLSSELREIYSRVLSVPAPGGAWTRGVPVARGLARALSELFMHLLERVVRSKASVRIIRLVDDVCFMTPSREHAERAWEAALEFLAAFDLEPNMGKCGALGLNTSETSGVLPSGSPRWGIWRMREGASGELEWALDENHLDVLIRGARERVLATHALIDAVRAYNEALGLFKSGLAIRRPLDASHRDAIGVALGRFEEGVFGEEGALEWCRTRLDPSARGALTEALLHWPITAGGLGLVHAHIDAARAERAWRAWRGVTAPQEVPEGWEVSETSWGTFFNQWSGELPDVHVNASPQMAALIKDFIQRGSEVGGRHQQGLSPYWRAVVQMYGPQLLERFGTFRFLLTELVPLRLITHGDSGLDDDLGPAVSGSGGYAQAGGFDDEIPF